MPETQHDASGAQQSEALMFTCFSVFLIPASQQADPEAQHAACTSQHEAALSRVEAWLFTGTKPKAAIAREDANKAILNFMIETP
ncbi:MAG: hypothetical protein IAF58_15375 [Leptolyngbya sp.]|nr:hypothetical protein [Candidatus Melainabacteria bacterium]